MADRILRAIISGDAAGAVSAFKETALSAEGAGGSIKKAGVEAGEGAEAGASKANTGLMGMASQLSNAIPLWGKVGIGVGVAAIGIGVAAIDMANKYEDSTAKMAAASGTSIDEAKKVGDAFLTTAGQSVFSAQSMMDAYAPVAGQMAAVAGHALNQSEALAFMNQATTLASATGQDLTTTTSNLSTVMQAFHQPLSAAGADADTLYTVSAKLGMPLADVTNQLDKLHAKLGDAGGGVQELSAGMLDFQQHGLSGRAAMSALTTATTSLESPSAAATKALNDMGLAGQENALKTGNIGTALSILSPKLQGMTQQQRQAAEIAIFGKSGYDQLNSTLMAGTAGYNAATAAVTKHGTASQAANTATSTLSGSFDKIKGAVADVGVKLGQFLLPILNTIMEWVAKAVVWFAQILPGALNVVGAVFGVIFGVISAIVQRIVIVIQVAVGIVIPIIQTIATIFGVVFGIIAGVVGAIVSVIQAIIPPIAAVVGFIFNVFATTFHVISTVIGVEIGIVKAIITGIVDVVQAIAGPIGAIFSAIGGAIGTVFQGVSGVVQGIWNGVIGAIKGAINGVIGIINGVIGAIDAIQVHIHVGPVNLDWNGLQIGKVPTLDSGAIVSGPTFAALAMNSRPEVVAPLDELPGLMARRGGGGSVIQITQNFTLNGNDERLLAQVKQEVETNNDTLTRTILARAA